MTKERSDLTQTARDRAEEYAKDLADPDFTQNNEEYLLKVNAYLAGYKAALEDAAKHFDAMATMVKNPDGVAVLRESARAIRTLAGPSSKLGES